MRPRHFLLLATLLALLAGPVAAARAKPRPKAPAAASASAAAAPVQPLRRIEVRVLPFYAPGATPADPSTVAVDPAYDAWLASPRSEDVARARDAIAAHPERVSPETMMVLAIRQYDMDQRDDAVFWYYVARDRFQTMDTVLDLRSLRFAHATEAMDSFIAAIGPVMAGYAFCDPARQQEREDSAIGWVEAHPYQLLADHALPALFDDRAAGRAAAIAQLRKAQASSRAYLALPDTLARLADLRARTAADAQFCWK